MWTPGLKKLEMMLKLDVILKNVKNVELITHSI